MCACLHGYVYIYHIYVLHCNVVSHWLGAYTKRSLYITLQQIGRSINHKCHRWRWVRFLTAINPSFTTVHRVKRLALTKFPDHFLIVPDYKTYHDAVIKWKHFPRYWPYVRGIHRSTVNSPHKGQWRGALMCFFICVWINGWVNSREAGDLRRYRAHYDVIVMLLMLRCGLWYDDNVYQMRNRSF